MSGKAIEARWLRGKSWSIEEERRLRELVNEGFGIEKMSKTMGKTRVSVRAKLYHLGLVLVDATTAVPPPVASVASIASVASTLQTDNKSNNDRSPIPAPTNFNSAKASQPKPYSSIDDVFAAELKKEGPLPSPEEKLRVLNAALVALEQPGLSISEATRLNKLVNGVKIYHKAFADIVNYQRLENEILELRKQLASEREQK